MITAYFSLNQEKTIRDEACRLDANLKAEAQGGFEPLEGEEIWIEGDCAGDRFGS